MLNGKTGGFMKHVVAVTASRVGGAHAMLAAEALKATAALMGHRIRVEIQGPGGLQDALSGDDIRHADLVIVAADQPVEIGRFQGKPVYRTTTSEAIRRTERVLRAAIGEPAAEPPRAAAAVKVIPAPRPAITEPVPEPPARAHKRIVAVTSCPTGIAHTFMAAEALQKGARALGHDIKVETQGSVGAGTVLTPEDIAAADLVLIAADTNVALDRFRDKPVYMTSTAKAIKGSRATVETAIAEAAPLHREPAEAAGGEDYANAVGRAKAERSAQRSGAYKHLMTGVSYVIPIVVAGGLTIAMSFAFGIDAAKEEGSLAAALMQIGSQAAFLLMVPVLSGFIAFSIADRPGLAPGLIGGVLANQIGAGFLGGIASGFLAGYVALGLREHIRLPRGLEGLKPVLIIPLIATLVVGLLMIHVVGTPIAAVLAAVTQWLSGMTAANAVVLGLLLGGMMAFDMGGPINKAAYTFAVGLLGSESYLPMAATMAAGMTPPLGLALATLVARNRFTADERDAGKVAAVLGASFITEGAIPFAAKDPLRVIPALVAGSAVAGGLSMLFGCMLRAPHGGVFVLTIPNAVTHVGLYVVAILAGTLVTTALVVLLKRPGTPAVAGAPAEEGAD
jgi:fructose PTS system EIIBC or EIIC component